MRPWSRSYKAQKTNIWAKCAGEKRETLKHGSAPQAALAKYRLSERVLQHILLTPAILLCNSTGLVIYQECVIDGFAWSVQPLLPCSAKKHATTQPLAASLTLKDWASNLGSDNFLGLPFKVWGSCRAEDAFVSLNNHYQLLLQSSSYTKKKSTGRHQVSESHFWYFK